MRIELKKGKQRELLNEIKNNNHSSRQGYSQALACRGIALLPP